MLFLVLETAFIPELVLLLIYTLFAAQKLIPQDDLCPFGNQRWFRPQHN
jgi:hypothetical protein